MPISTIKAVIHRHHNLQGIFVSFSRSESISILKSIKSSWHGRVHSTTGIELSLSPVSTQNLHRHHNFLGIFVSYSTLERIRMLLFELLPLSVAFRKRVNLDPRSWSLNPGDSRIFARLSGWPDAQKRWKRKREAPVVSLSQKDIYGSKSNKMRQVQRRDELDNRGSLHV